MLQVHGFAIPGADYSALARLLAVRGYAVATPDVYPASDAPGGATEARRVACWAARVAATFPCAPLVLAGHSRGGQAAFMALQAALRSGTRAAPLAAAAALLLLDVVEGAPSLCGLGALRPRLLARVAEWPPRLCEVPVLIVGAALGAEGTFAAAPAGRNYCAVWRALETFAGFETLAARRERPPGMFMVTAAEFGHLDYLNDTEECTGLVAKISRCVVRSGKDGRAVFREFVATLGAEFLDAYAADRGGARETWLLRVASLQSESSAVCGVRAVSKSVRGGASPGASYGLPATGATVAASTSEGT